MAIAAVARNRSVAKTVFALVWAILGASLLAVGLRALRNIDPIAESARHAYLVVAVFGGLALATGVTRMVPGRLFCFVGGATAIALGLYGAGLILLGSEDVGGLGVAVPGGLSAIALSAWTLVHVRRRARDGRIDVA